jgi:hypothetical protein
MANMNSVTVEPKSSAGAIGMPQKDFTARGWASPQESDEGAHRAI